MAFNLNFNPRPWVGGAVLLLAVLALVIGLYSLISGVQPTGLQQQNLPIEVRLPVLAIGGVIALLVVIAMVAGAFTLFNLANPNEALGLPEGSVRAIIALSLIVLFAILTIYLYSSVSKPQLQQTPQFTALQRENFLKNIQSERVIATISNGTDAAGVEHFTMYYHDGSTAGEDFAKQLLVMIGTLMTSVTSFYFATKSLGGSGTTNPPRPNVTSVRPPAGTRGTDLQLEISGDNLDQIKEVKATQGNKQVLATELASGTPSLLKCKLNVPATESAGVWALVVTDKAGQSAQLPNALTLT